jgi:hypothetical protein
LLQAVDVKLDGLTDHLQDFLATLAHRHTARQGRDMRSPARFPTLDDHHRFTAEYKLRILREAESQSEPGAIVALLRREGLYSTHLSAWRRQRERWALEAMRRRGRGRKPDTTRELRERLAKVESEKERLEERLRQAEAIITAQERLSEILGLPGTMAARRESA